MQAGPARLKSAVRLEGVVLTFAALYPGHKAKGSLELMLGTTELARAATVSKTQETIIDKAMFAERPSHSNAMRNTAPHPFIFNIYFLNILAF